MAALEALRFMAGTDCELVFWPFFCAEIGNAADVAERRRPADFSMGSSLRGGLSFSSSSLSSTMRPRFQGLGTGVGAHAER